MSKGGRSSLPNLRSESLRGGSEGSIRAADVSVRPSAHESTRIGTVFDGAPSPDDTKNSGRTSHSSERDSEASGSAPRNIRERMRDAIKKHVSMTGESDGEGTDRSSAPLRGPRAITRQISTTFKKGFNTRRLHVGSPPRFFDGQRKKFDDAKKTAGVPEDREEQTSPVTRRAARISRGAHVVVDTFSMRAPRISRGSHPAAAEAFALRVQNNALKERVRSLEEAARAEKEEREKRKCCCFG